MKESDKITVMVTGVGGGGHGEQILKALRLSLYNYEIIGGDMSPVSKGLFGVDCGYILPPATDSDYIPALLAVCRKHRVRVLFHGSEPELKVMSREREKIIESGIFLPINSQEVISTCMNKYRTYQSLVSMGFRVPRTVRISSCTDTESIKFFPAVLKPSLGGGSVGIMLVQTREEASAFVRYLLTIYPEIIAQEYVGTPDSEYTVGVLLSMEGELINSIAVRRSIMSSLSNRLSVANRTENKGLGSTLAVSSGISQGEIGRFPEVTEPCEKLALALGARGTINIQCRYVEGEVYVFEINPRFSGTTSLRAMVGYNEPDILIRKHVLGEEITKYFSYRTGLVVRGLDEAFVPDQIFHRAKDLIVD